jgi:hypothetical protein
MESLQTNFESLRLGVRIQIESLVQTHSTVHISAESPNAGIPVSQFQSFEVSQRLLHRAEKEEKHLPPKLLRTLGSDLNPNHHSGVSKPNF